MADPFPKERQLARGQRRYLRKVASPAQWQRIIETKGSTCRLSDHFLGPHAPIEYHHLLARAQGGDDCADNVVPLCRTCHAYITAAAPLARQRLASELLDGEYAYVIAKLGEGALTRLFGV